MNSLSLARESARPHLRELAKDEALMPGSSIGSSEAEPGTTTSSALADYYQHCLGIFMKADSFHHHQQQAADRRASPSPMMEPANSNHAPHRPGPQSWMAAMAASTFPWSFIPQVKSHVALVRFQFDRLNWLTPRNQEAQRDQSRV